MKLTSLCDARGQSGENLASDFAVGIGKVVLEFGIEFDALKEKAGSYSCLIECHQDSAVFDKRLYKKSLPNITAGERKNVNNFNNYYCN